MARAGLRVRGVIEGFYGPPWSHAERLDLLAFCGRHGLDTWVHAPKDDPWHRARWRDPYPDDELARLAELAAAAARHGVELAWAVAPGLSMCCSDERDREALGAKCDQLRLAGVRRFQLLWDDLEDVLRCAGDERRYGTDPAPTAAAHADVANWFLREVAGDAGLVLCPREYAGTAATPYREALARLLDPAVLVCWTGPEVAPRAIAREQLDDAAAALGHRLLLWDNYPVNDFDRGRLNLGPLRGRDPLLAEGPLEGIVANGMLQAVPSKLALATVADWARDPGGYDPVASFERALEEHGTEVVEALRALAPRRVALEPPEDVAALVAALASGVDAATGLALLEPLA